MDRYPLETRRVRQSLRAHSVETLSLTELVLLPSSAIKDTPSLILGPTLGGLRIREERSSEEALEVPLEPNGANCEVISLTDKADLQNRP